MPYALGIAIHMINRRIVHADFMYRVRTYEANLQIRKKHWKNVLETISNTRT